MNKQRKGTNFNSPAVTTAGVHISSTERFIKQEQTQKSIEDAISKILFNVYYEIKKDSNYMRDKNPKDCQRLCKNKSSKANKGHIYPRILWSVCDVHFYSFEYNGEEISIYKYDKVKYGITLKFPHMPTVCVGRRGG
mmetsp:Transcript_18667/g.30161  ORF Transcript_18667/g.30161 Transcript_18667/m.30161 type:complete len:137 (+) Transcript_18667:138-548(+)